MTLLSLFDKYIFSGVPSSAAWDLTKATWEKLNQRSWKELYLDAFESALVDERPRLQKYAGGEISLSRETLHRALHQDLAAAVYKMPLSSLTDEEFIEILASALKERQALVIGGHNLTEDDYAQLIRNLVRKAAVLFKTSVTQNPAAFQQAMLAEAQQNQTLVRETQTYLEQRFDLVLQQLDAHTALLQQIIANTEAIKEGLGLDRPQPEIRNEIQASIESQRPDMFKAGGLCAGRPLFPALDQFFVAQEFSPDREDLLRALASTFRDFNLNAYRADQDIEPGHILCKIAAKIQTTLFSVFELTRTQNRNVYLELGIAIGLRRPFVLVKEAEAKVSSLAQGLDYYNIRSYAGMQGELGQRLRQYLFNIARYRTADLPQADSNATYILAHGDYDMPPDYCLTVAEALVEHKLMPVLLGTDNREAAQVLEGAGIEYQVIDGLGKTRLDATVQAIQAARFGVYRIDASCSPDAFLTLGLAIGLNRPRLLISREGVLLPADVRGLSGLEFRSFAELTNQFPKQFGDLLKQYC